MYLASTKESQNEGRQSKADHEASPEGQRGPEGKRCFRSQTSGPNQEQPEQNMDQGCGQNDVRQGLPSEPGADRGEHLEIAMTNPLPARPEPIASVDEPEGEVSRHGPDDGVFQRGERAIQVDQQPGPYQGQGDPVGKDLPVEIDRREQDQ